MGVRVVVAALCVCEVSESLLRFRDRARGVSLPLARIYYQCACQCAHGANFLASLIHCSAIGGATLDVLMACLPRVYRHRPPEIRGSSVIRKKLLLDRLAVATRSKPRSCGMKTQREPPDSRSASRHARALIRAARQALGGVSLSRRRQAARERNGARSWSR